MTEKIIIAGAGGQGVMLAGKILAEAAMQEKKNVTWLPAYGAEVRGGTAYCMVIISDQAIGSPYIDQADSLIILNAPSFKKFKERINPKGILLVNSSLVKADKKIALKYPFTETAFKLGNGRAANVVALGSLLAQKKILKPQTILAVMQKIAPRKELYELNCRAFAAGEKLSRR
jgi:2-oxoglutarate ferredoxin oxidoreductase subunit gamma